MNPVASWPKLLSFVAKPCSIFLKKNFLATWEHKKEILFYTFNTPDSSGHFPWKWNLQHSLNSTKIFYIIAYRVVKHLALWKLIWLDHRVKAGRKYLPSYYQIWQKFEVIWYSQNFCSSFGTQWSIFLLCVCESQIRRGQKCHKLDLVTNKPQSDRKRFNISQPNWSPCHRGKLFLKSVFV